MGDELAGKVAIVTGGASGLGRATVELFVEEGARVVIADQNAEAGAALATELGDAVAFKQTDVADTEQVQALVDFTVDRFGGLHAMFNNAGISSNMSRFLDDELTDFDRVVGVNLRGVMVCSQRAARHMAANGGGAIVNTASIAGINAGAGLISYRVTKAAVIHFSRCIAIDLAEYGIRVNCLAPAHIATAINTNYDVSQIIRLMQPLQRAGTPNDVANSVLFLVSDRAAQITGVVLPVDGGTTAGPPANQLRQLLRAPGNAKTG
jgi:NAD(P)-dependent dehydrogenase (short-subunit alcohol dehydrogenase family)